MFKDIMILGSQLNACIELVWKMVYSVAQDSYR